MNDLTHANSTALSTGAERNAFEQYAEAASRNKIVGDLLKFSKGEYLAGQDGDEIEEGTELVANLDELMVGWVKWEGGKPTDMQMGRVVEGFVPAKRADLGDTNKEDWEFDDVAKAPRDPWQLTNYLILKEPNGDRLFTFATSSKGGMSAIGKLCGVYGKRLRSKPNDFPVIALNVDSYKHSNKSYGKIFVPDFEVVSWSDKGAFADALAADAAASSSENDADDAEEQGAAPTVAKNGRGAKAAAAAAAGTRF